ncbi:lysylphosphatidylglycerol synthase domain-containing protein, partial [bacterium]
MNKRKILFLLKIFIAVIVLLWVINKVQYSTIIKSFQNPESPHLIIIAFVLLIPNLSLQWYRWYYLLRLIKSDIPVSESIISLFGGLTVGLVTPGRIGEFGRTLFLSDVNRIKTLGMIFIDKFYSSIIVIIFGIWGVISFLGFKLGFDVFLLAPLIGLALLATWIGIYLMMNPKHLHTFFYNVSLLFP